MGGERALQVLFGLSRVVEWLDEEWTLQVLGCWCALAWFRRCFVAALRDFPPPPLELQVQPEQYHGHILAERPERPLAPRAVIFLLRRHLYRRRLVLRLVSPLVLLGLALRFEEAVVTDAFAQCPGARPVRQPLRSHGGNVVVLHHSVGIILGRG